MKLPFILLRRRQWQSALDDIARQKCEINELQQSLQQLQGLYVRHTDRIDTLTTAQRDLRRDLKKIDKKIKEA